MKRLDQTSFSGLTGGQYCFYNKGIHGYGGYGFWQTNGQLRLYVPEKHEWDLVKLNQVVPSRNYFTFYDHRTQNLWVGQQDYINEILDAEHFQVSNEMYRLSMTNRRWEKLGVLSFTPDDKDVFMGVYLETPNGVIVNTGGPRFELWDFQKNRRYSLGDLSDSLRIHFIQSWNDAYLNLLFINGHVVLYNNNRKAVFKRFRFRPETFTLLDEPIYKKTGVLNKPAWLAVFSLLPLGLLVFWKRGRIASWLNFGSNSIAAGKRAIDGAETITEESGGVSGVSAPARVNIRQVSGQRNVAVPRERDPREVFLETLTTIEKEILHRLSVDFFQGDLTHAEVLNQMLGTERKSQDVQKRHRSDTLNSINSKYAKAFNRPDVLVERKRSDADARQFDYTLNASLPQEYLHW